MKKPNPAAARIRQAALELFAEKGNNQITVSELAQAAGIARGTIYNNLKSPDALFEDVAVQLSDEMHRRVLASLEGVEDSAQRVANGMRLFIRRAHEEPHWGRFITRFAFSNASLQGLWNGPPMRDVLMGIDQGRYNFRPELLPGVIAMIAGSALTAMLLVLEGHRTWREAGSEAAELALRAMGVNPEQARAIATSDLPPLPEVN